MKSKALTYVLLLVVGIIWYQVFIRVKSNLTDEGETSTYNTQLSVNFKPIVRDTFILVADYRDPFGGALKVEPISTNQPNPEPIYRPAPPKKVEEQWPNIKYFGLVRKTDSNSPLGIISIDGIQLHLRKGESVFDDINIKAIGRDSIQVKYHKKLKTFWRE